MTKRAVTRELAQYIADMRYDDLPQEVITVAKEAVLDQFGVLLMGSTLPWTQPSYLLVRDQESKPESTIVRYGTKVAAPDAAFANGTFAQSCELDDSGGGGHAGALTVSPALALAERDHLSGREFLLAIVLGYEVGGRVGSVVTQPTLDKGFHMQSVVGTFTAAAVAGKLLGLDGEQMVHALSIAGSHSGGTMEYDQRGGEVKRVHNAIAVRGGMVAAMLAQRGLTGPDTILEGPRGIPRLFADAEDTEPIVHGLGKGDWYFIQGRRVKTFPTVHGLHASIQALASLKEKHQLRPEQVEQIDIWIDPLVLMHGGTILEPTDTVSAQFSMAFSLGLRLVKGSNHLRDYMDPTLWKDPKILAVGRKVRLHEYAREGPVRRERIKMQVKLTDGRVLEREEQHSKGSVENPLTREELNSKFRSLASAALDEAGMQQLIDTVDRLEEVEDISQVVPLLVER